MTKDKNDLNFDVRVAERYIRDGAITREEYEQYLKKLPDVSEKGCALILEDETKEDLSTDSPDGVGGAE